MMCIIFTVYMTHLGKVKSRKHENHQKGGVQRIVLYKACFDEKIGVEIKMLGLLILREHRTTNVTRKQKS